MVVTRITGVFGKDEPHHVQSKGKRAWSLFTETGAA
jgi:hypothetical protein